MNVWEVFLIGLQDSLNPCNLVTGVIFAYYLTVLRKFQRNVSLWGWIFIVLSWAMVLVFGLLLPVFYADEFFQFGRMFYCAVGVVFMLFGCFLFRDWLQMCKTNSNVGWTLFDDAVRKKSFFILPALFVPVSVFILNALATIWPLNRRVTLLLYDFADDQLNGLVLFKMALYSLMMVLPLFLFRFWISLSSSNGWVMRHQTRSKIIVSAVFLALGFSLVYIFRL